MGCLNNLALDLDRVLYNGAGHGRIQRGGGGVGVEPAYTPISEVNHQIYKYK